MLELLNETEKEILFMLIRGQNYQGISQWLCIDYKEYLQAKRSLYKKLKVKRVTQLLPWVLKAGIQLDDL